MKLLIGAALLLVGMFGMAWLVNEAPIHAWWRIPSLLTCIGMVVGGITTALSEIT